MSGWLDDTADAFMQKPIKGTELNSVPWLLTSVMHEKNRQIIHLDMDAFYASVEQLDNPELKGKPVIVGGTSKRGVVSAASYEARKFKIHSAMPIAQAMKLCPHGIFLPVRMKRYKEISNKVFGVFQQYTPLVESVYKLSRPVSIRHSYDQDTPWIQQALHITHEPGWVPKVL